MSEILSIDRSIELHAVLSTTQLLDEIAQRFGFTFGDGVTKNTS
jgi:hypothetical protein